MMISKLACSCTLVLLTFSSACRTREFGASSRIADGESGVDLAGVTPTAPIDPFVTCPVKGSQSTSTTFLGKSYTYKTSAEANVSEPGWEGRVAADWQALDTLIPDDMNAVVIDIRRVNGVPHYLYLGNRGLHADINEPWSSSKFISASAAISRVRTESEGRVGANSKTSNGYPIGDLITDIHSYRERIASSNSIARYFLEVARADQATALFHDQWLKLGDASRLTGAWGEPTFGGGRKWDDFDVRPNAEGIAGDKRMSALAEAEWLKRLTQHETDPATRLPGFQKEDAQVLFYGSPIPEKPGGMLSGVSLYIANGLNDKSETPPSNASSEPLVSALREGLDRLAGPQWRIFHKVGWGDSSSRDRSETILAGYACLPQWDEGHEFVIFTRSTIPGRPGVSVASKKNQKAVTAIIGALKQAWASSLPPP